MNSLFRLLLILIVALSGCSGDKSPTRHNDFTPLTSIEIKATTATNQLAQGTSTRLTAVGNFSGLFTRDISDEVVWTTADQAKADFVAGGGSGRIRGKASGSVILTASKGAVSTQYTLTVSSATITGLTISPTAPSVAKGLTAQFTANGSFSDATTQDLTFDAAWTSSDTTVATIGDTLASKGLAQTVAAGSTTITASFNGASNSTVLTVTVPVLQSIAVTSTTPAALSLSTATFTATGTYTDKSTVPITSLATTNWSSSQTGVATIASGGAAKTLSQGTTTITAAVGSISGFMNFKVTGGNLTGITLSAPNVTLVKDTSIRMTATGTFSNGSAILSRDISGVVDWTVTDATKAVVTVAGTNLVWLKASAVTVAGVPTTVTAKSGSVTATANLTVTNPSPLSIAMSPTTLELYSETGGRFTLAATYNDGTTQDVTADSSWSSNDTAKAKVSDSGGTKGRVSGVTAGSTTISATYGSLTAVKNTVTVVARTLQSLAISPASATISSGNQVTFTATASYNLGPKKDVTEDATWTLDKTSVAILADTTNQPGQVVAVDGGSATLTATFGGKSATATITVP